MEFYAGALAGIEPETAATAGFDCNGGTGWGFAALCHLLYGTGRKRIRGREVPGIASRVPDPQTGFSTGHCRMARSRWAVQELSRPPAVGRLLRSLNGPLFIGLHGVRLASPWALCYASAKNVETEGSAGKDAHTRKFRKPDEKKASIRYRSQWGWEPVLIMAPAPAAFTIMSTGLPAITRAVLHSRAHALSFWQ